MELNVLTEILKGYSSGELASFVGSTNITNYEKLVDREITKNDFIIAVEVLIGYELISKKPHRDTLIARMSPVLLDKVLDKVLVACDFKGELPVLDKYDLLIWLADKHQSIFINAMGYGDLFETNGASLSSVQGIVAIEPHYPLYEYQQKIVSKVQRLVSNEQSKRCLIHLPTGAGKTRTAINIVCEHLRANPKGLVLWLADTSELCSQAAKEFSKAWSSLGNRTIKQYEFYSDTAISLGGIDCGFLVAGLQKLNAVRGKDTAKILYEKLQGFVTLIVFDEAHKAIAPTYAQTVTDMLGDRSEAILLGLSATPGRKLNSDNDEDMQLSNFFGNNKITMKVSGYESPIKYLVEEGYLAKAEFINIEYSGNKILHADSFSTSVQNAEIRNALSEDENRNVELLRVISDEYKNGNSMIVFACSVDHSITLSAMLAFEGIKAYSLDSRFDDPESRRFKISEYSEGRVKILINYSILTAGFDAPITNVAIIARPTDSLVQYSQMAGRAMRGVRSKGNTDCRIYTVQDDIPAFKSVIHAFEHWDELWSEV
jgi:DNA repair protein RadD